MVRITKISELKKLLEGLEEKETIVLTAVEKAKVNAYHFVKVDMWKEGNKTIQQIIYKADMELGFNE